jgi:hypothetical protein
MTGYKPSRNDLSSKTSNAALATALIALTGHVKQVKQIFFISSVYDLFI